MNLSEKEAIVAQFSDALKHSEATFLVDYSGTTCGDLTGVRRKLKGVGAKLVVGKNTLVKRAISGTTAAALSTHLKGATAVVWAKDPVSPAKVLTEFAKDKETFKLKGGFVDGALVGAKEIEALAKMPSKSELQAKLLSVVNAPATQLVRVLNAPATDLVRLLEAWRAELEKRQV